MMKLKLSVLTFGVITCLLTQTASAQQVPPPGPGGPGPDPVTDVLTEIKSKLTEFYDAFQSLNGSGIKEFVAPTQITSTDIDKLKTNDSLLAALYGENIIFKSTQSATINQIIDLVTTPKDYTYCVDCGTSDNILSANDVMKVAVLSNAAIIPYKNGVINKTVILQARQSGQDVNASGNMINNMDSLIGNIGITPDSQGRSQQQQALEQAALGTAQLTSQNMPEPTPLSGAQNFINASSGLINPLRLANVLKQDTVSATGINPYYDYLSKLVIFASRQSVGLSNLNFLLAKRMRPNNDPNTKSMAEIEKDNATRRLSSDWRNKMENSNPLTLQREMLYLLADINNQLYEQRMLDERMLATVSVFQLQNLDFAKEYLQNLDQ